MLRDLLGAAAIVAFLLVGSIALGANPFNDNTIVLADQFDDKLAHESDGDLVDDFIFAYSIDFDRRVQDELKSGQITDSRARTMKEQFHARGTGFADQMREMFEQEYPNQKSPFDKRLRAYLRKCIRSLWKDNEVVL